MRLLLPYSRGIPLFRRKPKTTPFHQLLQEEHAAWAALFDLSEDIEEPNRIVLASASAGAVVALSAFGEALQMQFFELPSTIPLGLGKESPDRIVEFAHALDDAHAVDAAHRVLTWAYVAEFAAFFWRPNYEYELDECAKAFELRNVYESTVLDRGKPATKDADPQEKADRWYELAQAALLGMMSAALNERIEPGQDPFINVHMPSWLEYFSEGRLAGGDRLTQLAPDGLPIWE